MECELLSMFKCVLTFVCSHPMFPLLALLLEKCEAVTNNLESAEEVEASLHTEVKIFLEQLILDSPLMTDNSEADEVVSQNEIKSTH